MPLRLYLFGPLRAFIDQEPLKFPPRSKVGALLAYLLLQRERPVPRSMVAYVLWPDEPEELLELPATAAEAMMHPQYILWAAAQTYEALGETQRARELLTQAYVTLQERANAILDPESQATFLSLPFNRQIHAAYKSVYCWLR